MTEIIRSHVAKVPKGFDRFKWYAPAFIWMVSSVGSGEILFTPRVGSRYHYELLWVAPILTFFMWVMIREIGRYTLMTGQSILQGYAQLPGPKNWAVWLIFVPQLLECVVTISGIAALLGSCLMMVMPGNPMIIASIMIVVSAIIVGFGKYNNLLHLSTIFAAILMISAVLAATRVFPGWEKMVGGLTPGIPEGFDLYFVLPWFGFFLAGAAGVMWFSYWVQAKAYAQESSKTQKKDQPREEKIRYLKGWFQILTTTAAIGVLGGSLIIMAFLMLGVELLGPQGIVPEGIQVAEDLTKLFSEVWGNFGYWLLMITFVIALWGTLLSNQDGWPRMFTDATVLVIPKKSLWISSRERLTTLYLMVFGIILPAMVFWLVRDPVKILSAAGIVAAAHMPVVCLLTLYLNRTKLSPELKPGRFIFCATILAAIFYCSFAMLYFLNLLGIKLT